ncbi:MAG: VCBS repeat-containing protein, partial [Flavobacteriales bacterium]
MFRSLILIPCALLTVGSWAQFGPEQIIASKDFKDASGINAIDVDNDGLIDLVVCEGVYGDDRILWYKNLGGGNFDWKRTISTVAPYPTRLVAADVDNDGTQDLICAPYSNGSFFWFKNNGDQPWPDQPFGQVPYPSGILDWAVGDLDMDSDQDVVFTMKRTQSQQETIVVGRCVNDGAGNFSATDTLLLFAPFDSLSILRKMAIVDMNQDGINDILFVGGGFSWLEGTGSGTFGARHELPLSAPYATTLKVEDVTGDGIPDILVSSYSSTLSLSQFNIYQNDGTGSLSSIYYSSGLPELQNIGLSDMNGDGIKDLLLAYRGNFGEFGGKSIWRTIQTTPSFAVSSTYEVMSPIGNFKGSDWADLDNNGMVDVAFAMEEDVRWFEQTQQDTVIAHHISSLGYHDVQMAEINGDGIPDLVSGGTAMYPGQGGGQFGPQQWLRDRPYFQYYAMADFDSDGDTDMVWSENGIGRVMLNDGQGHFTWACDLLHTYSDDDYMLPTIADIDGDGAPDIVFAMNYLGSTIAWYANLGGGQFSPPHILVAYDPFERAHFMEAADLDGDGDVDIGCRMTTTVGKFYIVRNQGQGVFSPPEVVCDLPTVCYTDMGDIDGDS